METAGKTLDEKELSDAMKETGLGTPATRAAIIEVLLKREYIVRNGKSLEATDKGIRLIEVVHPEVKSPAMTGQWEAYLQAHPARHSAAGPFLKGIEDYVREVVGKVGQVPASVGHDGRDGSPPQPRGSPTSRCPPVRAGDRHDRSARRPHRTASPLTELLHSAFGFSSFRPNQEAVCRAVIEGRDVLLVMPTGVRQVAVLPVARHRARRHHAGDQPADRADGRSGRQAQGARLRGGAHPLRPRPRRLAPGLHRLPQRQAAVPLHRAGAAARRRLSRNAGQAQAVADRHRRSALHFAMGARFPAGLPHARPVPAHAAARAR